MVRITVIIVLLVLYIISNANSRNIDTSKNLKFVERKKKTELRSSKNERFFSDVPNLLNQNQDKMKNTL